MRRVAVLVGCLAVMLLEVHTARAYPESESEAVAEEPRPYTTRRPYKPTTRRVTSTTPEPEPQPEGNPENRLVSQLIGKYPPRENVRPVSHPSHGLNLTLGYYMTHMAEFDAENMVATMYGWLDESWTDRFLTWDPAQHGGVDRIRVSPSRIWRPDIRDYNAAKDASAQGDIQLLALSSGHVMNFPPTMHRILCSLNGPERPESDHCAHAEIYCKLVLGSWTYKGAEMDIQLQDRSGYATPGINTQHFQQHPRWRMHGALATKVAKVYDCCPDEVYPIVKFEFCLQKASPPPIYETYLGD